MLNTERVDRKVRGANVEVEIEFSTSYADRALTIVLSEDDAWSLAQMIIDRCSFLAKKKREEI